MANQDIIDAEKTKLAVNHILQYPFISRSLNIENRTIIADLILEMRSSDTSKMRLERFNMIGDLRLINYLYSAVFSHTLYYWKNIDELEAKSQQYSIGTEWHSSEHTSAKIRAERKKYIVEAYVFRDTLFEPKSESEMLVCYPTKSFVLYKTDRTKFYETFSYYELLDDGY